MHVLGQVIDLVLYVFLILLLIRIVISWIEMFARDWRPKGPLVIFLEVVFTITDPPVRFFGRLIPPLRLGHVMLDMGFLVLLVVVYVLMYLNRSLLL